MPPSQGSKASTVGNAGLSRAEFVYAQLREEIRARRLLPGDRLRELELADRLGVSRTPVREALKRLESDGLIENLPGRGLSVTQLQPARVMELYAMREVLEGAAGRFAATQASPLEIQTLHHLLEQLAQADTPEQAAAANRKLHQALVQAAHNVYLANAFNVLADALVLLGTTTYSMPGRIASGLAENREIVQAVERHDPDAAEQACRRHIRTASQLRLQMLFGESDKAA
jgi:Transcriptional regulators